MDNTPNNGVSIEWVLGGIATSGVFVAGFMWSVIKKVREECMSAINAIKGSVYKESSRAAQRANDAEKRYALRGDLDDLRDHMDQKHDNLSNNINQRFDQLTSLIIQQRKQQ